MKKKKIAVLHAQVPFHQGGAELHVAKLIENLKEHGFDAELIQIPYKWYPENTLYDSMLVWRLMDLSEANGQKVDLVIGTKFPSYGVKHDNKVVWVIHQFRQAYDLYDRPEGLSHVQNGSIIREKVKQFDCVSLKEAKLIFANSKNVSNRLKQFNQIDSIPLYHPPALVGRYKHSDYGDYILSVGRLDPLKRNDLLLEAIAKSKQTIKAKIAGKGSEMKRLKNLAKDLSIQDRIDFLGFVSDDELLELYANAFGVFFAPVDEDYGYITLEAFLSQKPVVTCTDSGGPLEFVRQGENGIICAPDPEHLAVALSKLAEDKNRCRKYGKAGFERVKNITWDHVIAELTKTL